MSGIDRSHPLVGKTLGPCRVLGKLGESFLGEVFLTENEQAGRESVCKVLKAKLSADKHYISALTRSCLGWSKLDHPKLQKVWGLHEEHGVHFLEVEYLEGESYDSLLAKGCLSNEDCLKVFEQAAEGLQALHRAGVYHKDIKPKKLFLGKDGQVKVVEAVSMEVADDATKAMGAVIGTPRYMSPEQCSGKPVDGRSDIYCLGGTIYFLATGKAPYQAETIIELMQKHLEAPPPKAREENSEISEAVENLVVNAMGKQADKRYQDMKELLEDIEKAKSGFQVRLREGVEESALANSGCLGLLLGFLWLAG